MSKNTKIEWAHHTFNPWTGCTKVGPGCEHCYAEGWAKRSGIVRWGPGAERRRTSKANWRQPIKWNAEAERLGVRYRVFCASLADVFDNAVPASWRADLFQLIERTPNLDWLLVTKRVGNVRDMAPVSWIGGPIQHGPDPSNIHGEWPPNVWLGITVVNQSESDRDIPKLLALPAQVRFLSMEPLLGPVDLRFHIFSEPTGNFRTHAGKRQMELRKPDDGGLHWVIVGGESGPHARPMHPGWVQSLRDQCLSSGVAFLFKQWGEWVPRSDCYHRFEDGTSCADRDPGLVKWPCIRLTEAGHNGHNLAHAGEGNEAYMQRVGKKTAGRMLDGRLWDEVPE